MRRLATVSAVVLAFGPAAAHALSWPNGLGAGGLPVGILGRITQGSSAYRYDFGPGYDGSDGFAAVLTMHGNPARNARLANEHVVNRPVANTRP